MSIAKKVVASIAAVAAMSAVAVTSAGAVAARPRSVEFTTAVQNVADNLNLDYFHSTEIDTRPAGGSTQEWIFKLVAKTEDGTGIYTIRWGDRSCIANNGLDRPVNLKFCQDGDLAQRWIVDTAQDHTTISSQKNPNQVLQGNGENKTVTAGGVFGQPSPSQLWTLYQP
ncbi:hypothetical protein SAMN05216371_0532 [Streptomyces sp. TLI_053]|uniref:hypothetical protein n=1 Tax=Streptomyces sp. TLI_053 TaxID=1855352 RepID=UPI00087D3732|nr:hypothetical protein [Streptomyces sp. TLI_053]SDS74670.1 hypothetical protein SAMN05216371_0532 [Streptomyces sp. TLI_053]